MARQFSLPEVAALEVGQEAWLTLRPAVVKRKVDPYGKRHNKQFSVYRDSAGSRVTRLPDPEPRAE